MRVPFPRRGRRGHRGEERVGLGIAPPPRPAPAPLAGKSLGALAKSARGSGLRDPQSAAVAVRPGNPRAPRHPGRQRPVRAAARGAEMRARRPLAPSRPLVRFLASPRPFGERMQDRAAAVTRRLRHTSVPRGPRRGANRRLERAGALGGANAPDSGCRPQSSVAVLTRPLPWPGVPRRRIGRRRAVATSRGVRTVPCWQETAAGAGGSVPNAARQPPVLGKGREGRCAGTGLEARPHVCDVLGSSRSARLAPLRLGGAGSLFFRVCSCVDWRLPP